MPDNKSNFSKVLRFITAGSVDDGKSTLIGRLLFDAKAIFTDQINALANSKHKRIQGQAIDFSLLTDGLEAEREQGITIDVAYRYFSTIKRKFIVADSPGHEQYTRNMVTGASNSDCAVILIDITRVNWMEENFELLNQTKRHSAIINLLGLQHIIIAVNKMDLVDFNQQAFDNVVNNYIQLANKLNITAKLYFIPISALNGDNIVNSSQKMTWYNGQTLLSLLENIEVKLHNYDEQNTKFAVQYILRQDGTKIDNFRGYLGRIEGGTISKNQELYTPHLSKVTVKQIFDINGNLMESARSADNITLTLNEDMDISRGDILSSDLPALHKNLHATVCWLDNIPSHSTKYLFKHTTSQIFAKISNIHSILDINTLEDSQVSEELKCNDIAKINIVLQKPLYLETFKHNIFTGSFILIDEVSHRTVAAGFIDKL